MSLRRRWALWGAVAAAAAVHGLGPRLPLVDLPQHAAQVTLLRDLLLGASPWADLVRINFVTPYLAGYLLALPLTFVMPVRSALAWLLAGALVAFVAASVRLRERLDGDPRLDWLFVAPFLGYAWAWGFYTFLVVSPLVMWFAAVSHDHARAPTRRSGAAVLALGTALLAGHALGFAFAAAIGAAWLVAWREVRLRAVWPYVVLFVECLLFFWGTEGFGARTGRAAFGDPLPSRAMLGVAYTLGWEPVFLALALPLFAAPLVLGLRFRAQRAAPLLVTVGIVALLPEYVLGTARMWERYAMFLLPFYAVAFEGRSAGGRAVVGTAVAVVAAVAAVLVHGQRVVAFAAEAVDFEQILRVAPPRHRAAAVVLDKGSAAAHSPAAYLHYPLWYQAEKGGLVDFNFAMYNPQLVRYRAEHEPVLVEGCDMQEPPVSWLATQPYTLFFVRRAAEAPFDAAGLAGSRCTVALAASRGAWSLYTRTCL